MKKYYCYDCGIEMNEGERRTFTCCGKCWDKHYKKADEQSEVGVEAKVGMPSETLSCEQVRNNTIEECAKHLEQLAEKANDVLVEERHILQEDTVELFRNDIDHARKLANNLRGLASKH